MSDVAAWREMDRQQRLTADGDLYGKARKVDPYQPIVPGHGILDQQRWDEVAKGIVGTYMGVEATNVAEQEVTPSEELLSVIDGLWDDAHNLQRHAEELINGLKLVRFHALRMRHIARRAKKGGDTQ